MPFWTRYYLLEPVPAGILTLLEILKTESVGLESGI